MPALQTLAPPSLLSFGLDGLWRKQQEPDTTEMAKRASPPSTSVQLGKHLEECSGGTFVPGTGQGWATGTTGGE